MTTRREWLTSTAGLAAALGLPPAVRADLVANRAAGAKRPYLDVAINTAKWIYATRQPVEFGDQYPADPLLPDSVGLDFYNGMPGVIAFYAALFHATDDVTWLRAAKRGADHLIHAMETEGDKLDAGLYTGLAGLGYTFDCLDRIGAGDRYFGAALRAARQIQSRVQRTEAGVQWTDSWDIISGIAGTGLFLLHAGREWDKTLVGLAAEAGTKLMAVAEPAEDGLMWFPSADFRRNYPNFSHGTAGVGYFLATLYQRTNDRRFLDGAVKAAAYLDHIATRKDGWTRIFHQSGGGEHRYYLSWCHGPVGTARLFYRLHQITRDPKWLEWVYSLTRGVLTSGAPEQRSEGYWNNISQCCGNVGIGQYLIDLARYLKTPETSALLERVVVDTTKRRTEDDAGLRWTQAENRTEPGNLVAQTGFMQGAAGVGTFFLQLDAFERGKPWRIPQPDTPFAD